VASLPHTGPNGGQGRKPALAAVGVRSHPASMFTVTEADAATIRAAFEQQGELSAAVEVRRLFPGVADMTEARECARAIAAWKPLPVKPAGALGRRVPIRPCPKAE
jgi:hypothetical protein